MIIIESPHIPPSVNQAYRNRTSKDSVKAPGRIKTKSYMTWFNAFGWDVRQAMRGKSMIDGPYEIVITLCESTRHPLSDIMNREKCVSDALQELGVIKDDRNCHSGTVKWGSAKGGIRVIITEHDALDDLLERNAVTGHQGLVIS